MKPIMPKIVTSGMPPSLYCAPGEASYSALARYGSRAAARLLKQKTYPAAKVTPKVRLYHDDE